jgi:hypothetical protein
MAVDSTLYRLSIWCRESEKESDQLLDNYKNSVRTSQETHYVSARKTNRLILFRKTISVYCENHTEHTDIHSVGRMPECRALVR